MCNSFCIFAVEFCYSGYHTSHSMKKLIQHIPIGTRHKLLFISHLPEGIAYINIGMQLARSIEPVLHDKHLSLIADEAIESIIRNHVRHDADTGDYVAIQNIGILFEPALHLDVHAKIDIWSKSYLLIVDCSENAIINDHFYLASSTGQHYSIDLSDISYIILR